MNELKFKSIQESFEDNPILKEVEKICSSDVFKTKRLLSKFLSYVVSESLAGRQHKIKGYSIAVDVFSKGEDFDADHNALIRIHAGRLRRVLKNYYSNAGKDDDILIEIPVGGYVPVFTANTNSGLSKEKPRTYFEEKTTPIQPTIIIFPFKNITGNERNSYFTQGFSEELSVELTKYEDLIIYDSVRSTSALYTQANTNEFIKNKGIHFVLEGAISMNGSQVVVLARLSDFFKGKQIWAQRYVKEITVHNLVEIQESIVKEIAGIIGGDYGIILQNLSIDAKRIGPKKTDTYNAILKFYYYNAILTPESAEEAFIALNQAVELEPDSGVATACLASMHCDSYLLDELIENNSYQLFGELAEKASILDPNNLLVNIVLAVKHFAYDEKDRFESIFEKCMKLSPNGSLKVGALAFQYMFYGGWDRGKTILKNIMESNIKYPSFLHAALLLYHYRKKEYELALVESNGFNLPELFWSPMLRIAVLGQLNKIKEAKQYIEHLKQLKPQFEEKTQYLLSRFIKEDELVEHVMDGIKKAGMEL